MLHPYTVVRQKYAEGFSTHQYAPEKSVHFHKCGTPNL